MYGGVDGCVGRRLRCVKRGKERESASGSFQVLSVVTAPVSCSV